MTARKQTTSLFSQQQVRRIWNEENEQWYFSIIDVMAILTDSSVPKRYWSDLISNNSPVFEEAKARLNLGDTPANLRPTRLGSRT